MGSVDFLNRTKARAMCMAALFCCLFIPVRGTTQSSFRLYVPSEDSVFFWKNAEKLPWTIFPGGDTAVFALHSRATLDSICGKLLQHFREQAYWGVSIDHLEQAADSSWTADLWLGAPLRRLQLWAADNRSAAWIRMAGYQPEGFRAGVEHELLLRIEGDILKQAENNGYPFAQVWLDSLSWEANGSLSAAIRVDPQRYFSFGAVKNTGDLRLPRYFLPRYLGLYAGMPYSRARVLRLRDQLQTLLFVESTANPVLGFSGNEAIVNLFLNKKRAGRFDFIIGILPPADAASGKTLLTGSVSAAFQNALNLGERFSMELERLRPETQHLDLSAGLPYLFGTAFGVDGALAIFKRDSSWVDAKTEAGASYFFPEGNFLRLLWENKSASLQKIDTAAIIAGKRLPANLDFRQNGFGLEAAFIRLDYRYNPRKGWEASIKATAGTSKVLRNSSIESLRDPANPEFRFAGLYDSVAQRSVRYRIEAKGAVYVPVFQRSAVKMAFRAAGIFSEKSVYANEQYRLGGNKLLRGFDEEAFTSSKFVVATAEWRLLLTKNAFLSAFADAAYLEFLNGEGGYSYLRPLGLGAGFNFETRAGIFGISVAVGRRDPGQPVQLRAAKFHLGYVSLF